VILLKFKKEIKGNSIQDKHEGWIALNSVDFNVGRHIAVLSGGTDRETSTPSFSNIRCDKELDIASVELFYQSICGISLDEATIDFIQTGGDQKQSQVYMTVTLTDPIISSYATRCHAGSRPSESFELNFTEITFAYFQFDGEKVMPVTPKGWNLKSGKAKAKAA
jgi:type VI secretion system secreted protein Hcp